MDISGLASSYTYIKNQATDSTANKLTQGQDYSNSTEAELMEACKEFEAYFVEQVFKGMEKTIPKSEEGDSSTSTLVDYFKGNMVQELAQQSTETNSIGLAQTMFEQMKRNYNL